MPAALAVVEIYAGKLAIAAGQSLKGEDLVNTLNRIAAHRGLPATIKVDNGSEFSEQLLDLWAYHHQTRINFSRPGKPTDNCHIEMFNGSFRDECLNLHGFESLDEAKVIIEA